MIKLILLFLTTILSLQSESLYQGISMLDTKKQKANIEAEENQKIRCRVICDKKIYKEQQISEAIEFYKKSLRNEEKR